jgi:tetratricopeptide (TPR) repeat protein
MEFIMSLNPNRRSSRVVRALLGMLLALVVGLPVASGYLSAQQNAPVAPLAAGAAEARFQDGVRLLGEKHYAEAEQAFREVQQMEPTGTRGLMGQVEAMIDQGQMDEPLKLLQAEIDREPARVDLRTAFGKTAVRLGRYDLAIAQFQVALGKTDKDSQAAGNLYLSIGETYRRKGDTESAIANLRRAAEILQESPMARNTLALALDSAGNKEEAQREYRAALAADSNNAVALNNLAYRLAEDGGPLDEALALVQRARKLQPDLNEISDTLGWIYLKMGRAKDAVPVFADLVQKRLQNPTFHFHLAMALQQTGDKFAAMEQLQTALQFNPPEELARSIRELLATIQH